MENYTIAVAIFLTAYALFDGGMQWQKMKGEEDKKIGKWIGVAVAGALGFWGIFILIRGA